MAPVHTCMGVIPVMLQLFASTQSSTYCRIWGGGGDLRAIVLYIHMKGGHSPVKRVHLYACGWHSSSMETAACFLTVCEPLCTLYPQSLHRSSNLHPHVWLDLFMNLHAVMSGAIASLTTLCSLVLTFKQTIYKAEYRES